MCCYDYRGFAKQKIDDEEIIPIMNHNLDPKYNRCIWLHKLRRTYLPFCDPHLPKVSYFDQMGHHNIVQYL